MLQAAAERCLEFMCARFTDPIYFGDYPKSIRDRIPSLPQFTPEQQAQLKGSADFFLINHYSTKYISHKADCSGEDGMSLFDGSSSVQHTERKGKPIGQQVTRFYMALTCVDMQQQSMHNVSHCVCLSGAICKPARLEQHMAPVTCSWLHGCVTSYIRLCTLSEG